MSVRIEFVEPGSLCALKHIASGDELLEINGHIIDDVLDYRFYLQERRLELLLLSADGKTRTVRLKKSDEYDDIGLGFCSYLMDSQRRCKNKCVFCFIDQMPAGMRESLYFKDDDSRLSFLFGNYITLTNLTEHEIQRIISMHISPVNVSVHTTNPELRVRMMKNPSAGESLKILQRLADAGIKLNAQLVLCPGINDGDELRRSLSDLGKLYPSLQSIAAVPVGLTDYREGLEPLEAYTRETANGVIEIIDEFNAHFEYFKGERLAFASDEFYLKAQRDIPEASYYGEFSQLDNGVGLLALMRDEFLDALENTDSAGCFPRSISLATGEAAYPLMSELCALAQEKFDGLSINVYEIKNSFFGKNITVAGLITGKDFYSRLRTCELGDELLIPAVSLRHEGDMFLDSMSLSELEKKLGVKVSAVGNDGYELLSRIKGGL